MTYSIAAAGAVFTGLLTIWDDANVRVAVLALGPLFLIFAWFMWFGELLRMARAARFLWELEKMVNRWLADNLAHRSAGASKDSDLDDSEVLHWESWVRGKNRWGRHLHLSTNYVLTSGLLGSMSIFSMSLAIVFAETSRQLIPGIRILPFCVAPVIAVMLAIAIRSIRTNPLLRRGDADNEGARFRASARRRKALRRSRRGPSPRFPTRPW
jgi:hypothetical protein